MDIIFECAQNFIKLLETNYKFVVSKKRKLQTFTVDFEETDFRHLAGLQYLTDIDIDRNSKKTLSLIINKAITDELLADSIHYQNSISTHLDIPSRLRELRYIEEYLDTDNMINIYNTRDGTNSNSVISAEYVIQSRRPGTKTDVYIFLRKRIESDNYLIVSFFVKGATIYSGEKLYWMLKQKMSHGKVTELFRHPNYSK